MASPGTVTPLVAGFGNFSSVAVLVRGHGHWFAPTSLSWMPEGLLMRLTSSVALFTCKGSAPKSWWARGLVLTGLLAAGLPTRAVRADTILNSGTTTVSTGTNFGSNLYVATTGTATLQVIAGGYATNTTGYLGFNAGSVGTATVSSGTWANSGNLTVGRNGTVTLTMIGGLVSVSGSLSQGNSPGALTVGSLSLIAGSHTAMDITGTTVGLYDQIVGAGSGGLTYGGSLNLVMTGSYADQTTFHLFSNFSSNTGDFSAVGLNATGEYARLTFTGDGGV